MFLKMNAYILKPHHLTQGSSRQAIIILSLLCSLDSLHHQKVWTCLSTRATHMLVHPHAILIRLLQLIPGKFPLHTINSCIVVLFSTISPNYPISTYCCVRSTGLLLPVTACIGFNTLTLAFKAKIDPHPPESIYHISLCTMFLLR